jgi:SAM-dependent methyltransferase
MKLSQLIAYRNYLNTINVDVCALTADQELSKILFAVKNEDLSIDQYSEPLIQQREVIKQNFNKFNDMLKEIKHKVQCQIEQIQPDYFVESYKLYDQEMCNETAEYILKRQLKMSYETKLALQTRLANYTSWQHAGMIIRPGLETFIYDMVSFDPLYVIDDSYELLEPMVKKFPVQYQRRLRQYVINEKQSEPMMSKIPDAQFGMCLSFYLFNFRPLEIIKKYLTEIYKKLKPGGVLIMTINDCDYERAVELAENHFACYTPGYLVLDLVKSLGYEILYVWNCDGSTTWIELSKPGPLTTLKGGQSLAKVVAYPN